MHHCAHLTSRCLRGLRPTYDMQLSDPVIRHLALFLCTTPHRLRHHKGARESRDAACGEGEHSLRAAAPEGASECQRQGMRARRVRRLRSRVGARAHLAEGLEHGSNESRRRRWKGGLYGGAWGGGGPAPRRTRGARHPSPTPQARHHVPSPMRRRHARPALCGRRGADHAQTAAFPGVACLFLPPPPSPRRRHACGHLVAHGRRTSVCQEPGRCPPGPSHFRAGGYRSIISSL